MVTSEQLIQCPFCGFWWSGKNPFAKPFILGDGTVESEAYQCPCGAWWYEGMPDV